MKFLLLVCTEPGVVTTGEPDDVQPWVDDLDARGIRLAGERLEPPSRARTVRVRDGRLMVTDGPYAETKEEIGGFDIIDCADLAEAVRIAAAHPMSRFGMLEVRPFWTGPS